MTPPAGGQGGPWQGQGPDLHTAINAAWNNAKGNGAQPGQYTVQSIQVDCSNPISSYIVVLGQSA